MKARNQTFAVVFDKLEPRLLMSADLIGSLSSFGLNDGPTGDLLPGAKGSAVVTVCNTGDCAGPGQGHRLRLRVLRRPASTAPTSCWAPPRTRL